MNIFTIIRMLIVPTQEEKDLADSLRKLKTLKVDIGSISISPEEIWEDNRNNHSSANENKL